MFVEKKKIDLNVGICTWEWELPLKWGLSFHWKYSHSPCSMNK